VKYIISEDQISDVLARIAKEPVDKSLFLKVIDFFKGDGEAIGRIILQSIKNGKAKITNIREMEDSPYFLYGFNFEISNLPIEFIKIKYRGSFDYFLRIPFFDIKKLDISDSISEDIFQSLFKQLKKDEYSKLFENNGNKI